MSALPQETQSMRVTSCMASEQPWATCTENFQVKVLTIDEARFSGEFLFKIKGGYRSERHKHLCETSAFVVEGRIKNETTGCEFGPGDFCYQPYDDEHIEHFVEDTVVFVTYRGHQDKLVEFYGEDGKVCGEFLISDFADLLPQ